MTAEKKRGLYEGLGIPDTRRPQSRKLQEACAPVSRAEFNQLVARVEELERGLERGRQQRSDRLRRKHGIPKPPHEAER